MLELSFTSRLNSGNSIMSLSNLILGIIQLLDIQLTLPECLLFSKNKAQSIADKLAPIINTFSVGLTSFNLSNS